MKCPFCQVPETRVIDSRLAKDGDVIRRRRECEKCNSRFTTYERLEEHLPMVVKKDGSRVSFDRNKLLAGLLKACEKRPVSAEIIEGMVKELEQDLMTSGEREVSSSYIGERMMERLRQIDGVAYVRFASVYRSFRDVTEFIDELKHILQAQQLGSSRTGAITGTGKQ